MLSQHLGKLAIGTCLSFEDLHTTEIGHKTFLIEVF
jgi:hypothetical protein